MICAKRVIISLCHTTHAKEFCSCRTKSRAIFGNCEICAGMWTGAAKVIVFASHRIVVPLISFAT